MAYRLRWVFACLWLLAFITWLWWMLGPSFFVTVDVKFYPNETWQFGGNGLHGVMGYFPAHNTIDRTLHFIVVVLFLMTLLWFMSPRQNWMSHQICDTSLGRISIVSICVVRGALILAAIACLIEALNLWHLFILQGYSRRSMVEYHHPVRVVIGSLVFISIAFPLMQWSKWRQISSTFLICRRVACRIALYGACLFLIGLLLSTRLVFMEPLFGRSYVMEVEHMQAGDDRFCGYYTTAFLGWTAALWGGAASLVYLFALPIYEERKDDKPCLNCGYDLRGSIAGDGVACPECGRAIVMKSLDKGTSE